MFQNIKILFVEDDPVFRSVITSFLKQRGAFVIDVETAEVGIEHFTTEKFDIVIADLKLPNMDGLTMLQMMLKHNPHIPSIVISGNELMTNVTEALRIGASDYLVKPITDLSSVEEAILSLLDVRPTTKSMREFDDNLQLLEKDMKLAIKTQVSAFPKPLYNQSPILIGYTNYANGITEYILDTIKIDDKYIISYFIKLSVSDHKAVIATLLIKSLINKMINSYTQNISNAAIEPQFIIKSINKKFIESGLNITADILLFHVNLNQDTLTIAKSGRINCSLVKESLCPFLLADTEPLGTLNCTSIIRVINLTNGFSIAVLSSSKYLDNILDSDFKGIIPSKNNVGAYLRLSYDK